MLQQENQVHDQTSSFIAIAKTTHIKQRIIKNIKNPIIITKFYNN